MNARPRSTRPTLTLLAAALTTALLAPTGTVQAGAPEPGAGTTDTQADVQAGAAKPRRTKVTFTVADCEGCKVQVHQGRSTLDADVVHVWHGKTRKVRDGKVTFRVPTRRTVGMSVTVRAPWEGHTGYATTVAWRYDGMSPGDPVTLEQALTKRRGSACWEGVRTLRRVTVPLVVERLEVDGVHGPVPGSIAFAAETSSWLPPMRKVWGGVLGSQDVNICDVQP